MADTHHDHDHDHEHAQQQGADELSPPDQLITGRAASVRFGRQEPTAQAGAQARMDAANQSLADALRITYRFLQAGMLLLMVLFIFSGLQRINEGERGIKVFLGKPTRTNLEPGAHLTAPYPIGEMIRVGEGTVEIPISRAYMPNRPGSSSDDALLDMNLNEFNSQGRLNPARDGSLITADLNIAHAQWTVNYRRANHLDYVKNILPDDERRLIAIAVSRGVVRTMSETTIDELLKNSAESIAARVRNVAQQTLDDLESGITIDRIVLVRKTPPLFLLDRFASVQSAAQNAGKEREDALLSREQILNEVAGRAAPVLVEMISEYERLTELGETRPAADLLAQIDAVLEGREVDYQGQSTLALVSGEVSEILNSARTQASSRVSRAVADLEQFRAKQAQFEANPVLMIARDWSTAMSEFLNKEFVTTMYLPEGVDAEVLLNPDPDIERERERIRKRTEALEAAKQRREEFKDDLYRSRRGLEPQDEP